MSETSTRDRAPWAIREWVAGTRPDKRVPPRQRKAVRPVGRVRKSTEDSIPAAVLSRAIEVLGSYDQALRWLRRPAISLSDRCPIELLGDPQQAALVEDLLTRIEYGVYT